jgi:hypothetical protein
VHADRDKILQVLINLLTNAVKFNRRGGRVDVRARPGKPGFVEVSVADTGVGIAPAEIERIFDRSYQARAVAGAPQSKGSGFGLAIVRDVLRLHGCRIRVSSEEERGTRFVFTLPAAGRGRAVETSGEEPPDSPEPENGKPADPEPAAADAAGQATVVSVDAPPAESEIEEAEGDEAPRPRFRVIRRREG